jgi:hypothetical protein
MRIPVRLTDWTEEAPAPTPKAQVSGDPARIGGDLQRVKMFLAVIHFS